MSPTIVLSDGIASAIAFALALPLLFVGVAVLAHALLPGRAVVVVAGAGAISALAAMALTTLTALIAVVDRGNISATDVGGNAVALIEATVPWFDVAIRMDAATALLYSCVCASAFTTALTLWPAVHSGRSAGPLLSLLAAVACVGFGIVARDLSVVCVAVSLSSLLGTACLVQVNNARTFVDAMWRIGGIHRAGDVCLALAVLVLGAHLGGIDMQALGRSTFEASPSALLSAGPLADFTRQHTWNMLAALVVVAALSRLLGCGVFLLATDAVTSMSAAGAFVHGVVWMGSGALLLWRFTALLSLAPTVLVWAGGVTLASVLLSAAMALVSRDILRIDLLLLVALAGLTTLSVLSLNIAAAILSIVVLLLVTVPLGGTGAAIVARTNQRDPHLLGGLEKRMPRAHTARLLSTGAAFGPLLSGALVSVHVVSNAWLAPWLGTPIAVGLWVALLLLSVAAFRVLHLVFTGTITRTDVGVARDGHFAVSASVIALALISVAIGLIDLPRGVLALLRLDATYTAPLDAMAAWTAQATAPIAAVALPALTAPPLAPSTVALLVLCAAPLGYAISFVLYRGGPGRALLHVMALPGCTRVVSAARRFVDRDLSNVGDVGDGAVRLSRMIAINLAPAILETALRRIPALFAIVLAWCVRVIAGGSAQRGVLVMLSTALVLVWWWVQH